MVMRKTFVLSFSVATIEIGARQYVAALDRFLEGDPVQRPDSRRPSAGRGHRGFSPKPPGDEPNEPPDHGPEDHDGEHR
jgi:hypothetical protein